MFDDICSSVVHSLPDSPFSLISSLTLYNHLILGIPLFRIFPSSFFLRSALLFSPYARTSSASYIGLPLRFLPLLVHRSRIVSFLILSTFVTSHIHHNNFFYPSIDPCCGFETVTLWSSTSFLWINILLTSVVYSQQCFSLDMITRWQHTRITVITRL